MHSLMYTRFLLQPHHREFDADGSGTITLDEVQTMVKDDKLAFLPEGLSPNDIMVALDKDGNGFITQACARHHRNTSTCLCQTLTPSFSFAAYFETGTSTQHIRMSTHPRKAMLYHRECSGDSHTHNTWTQQ